MVWLSPAALDAEAAGSAVCAAGAADPRVSSAQTPCIHFRHFDGFLLRLAGLPDVARLALSQPCRWALALQMVVLACTLAAWGTSYVHSFKNSLWSMAAVVAFMCIQSANQIYFSWQWSTVSGGGESCSTPGSPAAQLQAAAACCCGCYKSPGVAASNQCATHSLLATPNLPCVLTNALRAVPLLQGTTHRGLVVALYGLAILISGNYLMMGTGDAL